jgi:GT2 family glycosyltransferase
MQPVLSIITPTWNEPEKTSACFSSVSKHTDIPYELIWIDNGSSKQSFDHVSKVVNRLKVPLNVTRLGSNIGFVRGTNLGLSKVASSSKYVILLNNDTEVTQQWANKLLAPLADEQVGAVGPITQSQIAWQSADNLNIRWKLGLPSFRRGCSNKQALAKMSEYVTLLSDGFQTKYIDPGSIPLSFFCVALRTDTIAKVGILDEDFGVGLGDDDEYCHRLRTYGYKLMVSLGTFVYHWHRTTFKALRLPVDSIRRENVKKLQEKREKNVARQAGPQVLSNA